MSFSLLLAARQAQAQVQINFSNTASTAITNCLTGMRVVAGTTFRVALYVGPAGTTESALTAIASTGFSAAGLFNGGNVTVPGFGPGSAVTLQVRCWETAFGSTYEQAVAAGCLASFGRPALTGKSTLVTTVLPGSPNPPLTLPAARLVPFLVCRPPCTPTITCPPNIVVECTNAIGNLVNYAPTASSPCCPASLAVSCVPASGSRFSPGLTTVRCTANDGQNAESNTCSFTVRVHDTTPPAITCSSNLVLNADPGQCSKSNVNYTVTARDTCGVAALSCIPPSGSTFSRGTTTVTCTATDAATNRSSCSFTVTIVCTAPVITRQPISVTVTQGATARFTVTAAATPFPAFQWRFNGTPIKGAKDDELVLVGAGPSQVGDYDVVVSNPAGSNVSSIATLRLIETPPRLTVRLEGAAITVCWPDTAAGFRLEGTSDLTKPSLWSPVDGVERHQDKEQCLTVPLGQSPRFYRLVR